MLHSRAMFVSALGVAPADEGVQQFLKPVEAALPDMYECLYSNQTWRSEVGTIFITAD